MTHYNKEEIFEKSKKAIVDNDLIYIEEIISFLPLSKATFYDYFKIDSDELNELKELINDNKVNLKTKLRNKWYLSENATLQMGIYKLLANQDELDRLNNNDSKRELEIAPPPKIVIE